MRGNHRIALGAALVLTGAVAAFELLTPAEPQFEGRSLRFWLARAESVWYATDPGSDLGRAEVDHAVRQMGAKSLPVLVSMLQTRDGAIKRQLSLLCGMIPFLPFHAVSDTENHARALLGFKILREMARPAVAELAGMAARGADESAVLAAQALERIGPAATNAVPVLIKNLNSQDIAIRRMATNSLRRIDPLAAVNAGVKIG